MRDYAMVAMLIGCGLRRAELLALRLESIQQREEHWHYCLSRLNRTMSLVVVDREMARRLPSRDQAKSGDGITVGEVGQLIRGPRRAA